MNINFNSQLTAEHIEEICPLGKKQKEYMKTAYNKFGLTARNYHRILKVARTIADLEESRNIEVSHLVEAVEYSTMRQKILGEVIKIWIFTMLMIKIIHRNLQI